MELVCGTSGYRVNLRSDTTGNNKIRGLIPVKKNDTVSVVYTATLSNTGWRFIYAEGSAY
jgi:hypothetical protein